MDVEHLSEVPSVGGSGSEAENSRTEHCESGNLEGEKPCQTEETEEECANSLQEKGLQAGFELTDTVVLSKKVRAESVSFSPSRSPDINGRGAKRARIAIDEHQPSVQFIYNSLTRASRQKLDELLQQWSEWHAKHVSKSDDLSEGLESGEKTFFPALCVGLEKTSAVSFWMENQTINDKNKDFIPLDGNSVPLYDRGYALGLTSADGSSNLDGGLEIIGDASRCFNCGSYNHSLRECPRPRDNVAVNSARKQRNSRRNQNVSSRNPTRYYQNSPAGKYDGLRPGALDDVTRQLLGLGELDPPPWLNRMRELGYPPGYLDVDAEDQPSGITIYTDAEIAQQEDGEIMEVDNSEPKRRKMTVGFPGVNVPIPENANEKLWAAGAGHLSSDVSRNMPQYRSNHNTDYSSRGHYREQRLGDLRDDGPPGDPGHSSSQYSFHPRFVGHDAESPKPYSFHSLHYTSSGRLSPMDRDSGRLGNWTPESLYDRDRSLPSRFVDKPEDYHHRRWR